MRNLSELERAKRKHRIWLKAELSLRHAFERVDYDFDVVHPALEKLEEKALEEIPQYEVKSLR